MSDKVIDGVLVYLSNGCISGSKRDAEVTKEILDDKHAGDGAGQWTNKLFPPKACGKKNAYTALKSHLGAMRNWHYDSSYVFEDSLWRILPAKRIETYKDFVEVKGKAQALELLETFITELPMLKELAKTDAGRGNAYKESDYPDEKQIRAQFHYSVDYRPIPTSAGLNPALMQEAIDKLNELHARRLQEANETLIKRFLDPFKTLSEQLQDTDKRRIGTVLGTIREVAELIPSMDLSGNQELVSLAAQINSVFGSITPELIKKDEAMRKLVGDTCNQAVAALDRFGKAGARSFA